MTRNRLTTQVRLCSSNYQKALQTSPPVPLFREAVSILQTVTHHKDALQMALHLSCQLLSCGESSTGIQKIARSAQYFKGHYARLLALEE